MAHANTLPVAAPRSVVEKAPSPWFPRIRAVLHELMVQPPPSAIANAYAYAYGAKSVPKY